MVKFYISNTLASSSAKMLDELIKNSKEGTHIVIAPDRFTLSTESKLISRIGGSFNIEVLTFSRLAAKVLGNKVRKCLTPEGAVMLLAKTVDKIRGSLLCYSKMTAVKGFVNELYASISAIRNSGVSVEQMETASANLKGYIKDKTIDIARLYSGYIAELQDNYLDATSRLEALQSYIRESALCASAEFYITDFYAFTGKQYDIIKELMCNAKAVHIGVIGDIGGDNRRIFPKGMRSRLEAIAAECGISVETVAAFEALSPEKQFIENNIFGYSNAKLANSGYVNLYNAASIQEEIEYICCRIAEAVREKGLRYRSAGIWRIIFL